MKVEPLLPHSDEYISYFKLYGELIYCVPHYYESYEKREDGSEKAVFPNGSSIEIGPPYKNKKV